MTCWLAPRKLSKKVINVKNTYILGTLGNGGVQINFSRGQLFKEVGSGFLTSKDAALSEAAKAAKLSALCSESGVGSVAVATVKRNSKRLDLVAVATAERGRKNVRWS